MERGLKFGGKEEYWGKFIQVGGGGGRNRFLAGGGAPHYPPVGKSCGLRS